MKKSIFMMAAVLTIYSVWASDISFKDIAGKYKVTHEQLPITNTITIEDSGEVSLIESSAGGELHCEGQATIEGTTVRSKVKCENGAEFFQEIKLENVQNFSDFTAPVYSSLWDMEVEMDFEKL